MDGTWPGGGEGEGAALHGSRPSYVEAASGFSSTKLPPKLEEIPYAWVGRGALNIVGGQREWDGGLSRGMNYCKSHATHHSSKPDIITNRDQARRGYVQSTIDTDRQVFYNIQTPPVHVSLLLLIIPAHTPWRQSEVSKTTTVA